MYLRLTTFSKTLPQMKFHLFFAIFSALGLDSLLTAGALTDLQLLATTARLGGIGRVPPPPHKRLCGVPVVSLLIWE